jgi:hypothetical protein
MRNPITLIFQTHFALIVEQAFSKMPSETFLQSTNLPDHIRTWNEWVTYHQFLRLNNLNRFFPTDATRRDDLVHLCESLGLLNSRTIPQNCLNCGTVLSICRDPTATFGYFYKCLSNHGCKTKFSPATNCWLQESRLEPFQVSI